LTRWEFCRDRCCQPVSRDRDTSKAEVNCVPEVWVRLVCLHGLRREQKEHPHAATQTVSILSLRKQDVATYLEPITAVLPLIKNFSDTRYKPPGNSPKAAILSTMSSPNTEVCGLTSGK
jgi:hypothetical protein